MKEKMAHFRRKSALDGTKLVRKIILFFNLKKILFVFLFFDICVK